MAPHGASADVDAVCDTLELLAASAAVPADGQPGGSAAAPAGVSASEWAAVAAAAGAPGADGSLWAALDARGVIPSALGRALCGVVCGRSRVAALHAGAAYASLLASPGCPVFSLYNAGAYEGTLKALRDAAAVGAAAATDKGRRGKGAKAAAKSGAAAAARAAATRMDVDGEADEEEECGDEDGEGEERGGGADAEAPSVGDAAACGAAILRGVRAALPSFPLRDQPDALKHTLDALAALASGPPAAGLGGEALGALRSLLVPAHGDVLSNAAAQCQRLSPTLLASAGRGSAGAAALEYVRDVAATLPAARPAVAALVRHLCLRCGERADARARVRSLFRARSRVPLCFCAETTPLRRACHTPHAR
jgi:hypothetical protein